MAARSRPDPDGAPARRRTSTSNFGAGRRESHDAKAFYDRFPTPQLSDDSTVLAPFDIETPLRVGDARAMTDLADGSVALVVTSPPYFAGKQYEEELSAEGIPSSYAEYLDMLSDVFSECRRVLEPGGRVAVNVANLGRKPFRSLGSDVVDVLSQLGLLLRGEIVWRKGAGASGSCAWGSYRSPANPVLRDVTERVIVASKGRFDRALTQRQREASGLPHRISISGDEFMESTIDVWELPPESARRVRHPAPFPVALPERLIHLYTYENDLVLDPFLGSGTTAVAASRTRRRFVGYDTDPSYVAIAEQRVSAEGQPVRAAGGTFAGNVDQLLADAGATIVKRDVRVAGMAIPLVLRDRSDREWLAMTVGAHTIVPGGVTRVESAWATVGRVRALRAARRDHVVIFVSALPNKGTEAEIALRSVRAEGAHLIDVSASDALAITRSVFANGNVASA